MLVGVLNTLLDISAFTLLRLSVGVAVLPANVIAYGAGIINSFWWHRLWTYAHQPRKSVVVQFARFAIVSLSALLLNTFLVFWLSPRLGALSGSTAAGDLCAKLCATGIGLGWNFLANNAWTFRAEPISE